MAIKLMPGQVGPMTRREAVDTMVEFLTAGCTETEILDRRRTELENTYSSRQQKFQHGAIVSAFAGGKPERISTNVAIAYAFETPHKEMPFTGLIDGTIDYYAYYQSAAAHKERWGIYLVTRTMLGTLRQQPAIDAAEFSLTIAAHELFHLHSERLLGGAKTGHNCPNSRKGYCRLEEAAANFAAHDYARRKNFGSLTAMGPYLFAPYDPESRMGLEGYGEYGLLDEEIVYLLGTFKTQQTCTLPADYRLRSIVKLLSLQGLERLWTGSWETLLTDEESENVPFWIDAVS